MPTLTKEQIKELAEKLDSQYQRVYLCCDGYLVAAGMVRHKNKLVINVYVNGMIEGKWCEVVNKVEELPEESRRFWRHSLRSSMKPKNLKYWEKAIGKRQCKNRGYYDKRIIPFPYWNTAMTFIRHIQKYNESIKVISYEEHQSELEKLKATED